MTLFVMGETQTPVTSVPHRLLLNGWKARLETTELRAIEAEFSHLVGSKKGMEISTARWLPCEISPLGHHDWQNSAFRRIWDKVCEGDRARTCWCFAVLLFEHMMRRPEYWHFKTFDLDDVPMAATRYFRWPRIEHAETIGTALTSL